MKKHSIPTLSHPLSSQSGAMFGLDARIALAIFGVLSVVAGVAAINVFSQAGTTALIAELKNLKQAYTEFHLATGEHTLRFLDLINNDNNYPGWQGPYIDGMLTDKSRTYGIYSLAEGRQDVPGVPPVECNAGICATWIKLTEVKDAIAREAKKALDGEDNTTAGVFRIEYVTGPTDNIYYLVGSRPAGLSGGSSDSSSSSDTTDSSGE